MWRVLLHYKLNTFHISAVLYSHLLTVYTSCCQWPNLHTWTFKASHYVCRYFIIIIFLYYILVFTNQAMHLHATWVSFFYYKLFALKTNRRHQSFVILPAGLRNTPYKYENNHLLLSHFICTTAFSFFTECPITPDRYHLLSPHLKVTSVSQLGRGAGGAATWQPAAAFCSSFTMTTITVKWSEPRGLCRG